MTLGVFETSEGKRRISRTWRVVTFWLLLLVSSPLTAWAVPFELRAGGDFGAGNIGTSPPGVTKSGLTLTLTALSFIPVTDPDPTAGLAGTVFIHRKGAGVQTALAKKGEVCPPTCKGSKGISGKGAHEEEALVLTFSPPAITSTIVLTLTDYSITEDAVLGYVNTTSSPTLSEALIEDNLVSLGKGFFRLDFSDPDLGVALGGISSVSTLFVRATEGHFFVTGQDAVPPPEPASVLLLGSGLVALGAAARGRWRRGE